MAEPKSAAHPGVLPKHGQFYAGLIAGVVAFLFCLWIAPRYAFAVGVNVLFAVYLALMVMKFRHLTPEVLRRHADESDLPAWIILGVVLLKTRLGWVGLSWLLMRLVKKPRLV